MIGTEIVLEIATHDYGYQNDRLIEKTKNGSENRFRKQGQQPSTAQAYSMNHTGKI